MRPGVTINLVRDAVLTPEGESLAEVEEVVARKAAAGHV